MRSSLFPALLLAAAAPTLAQSIPQPFTGSDHAWRFWGGNLQNTHAADSEHRISPANASQLQEKWVFTTAGDVSATPTVENGSVYVPDWGGYLYRIDAETGKAIWTHKVSDYTGNTASISRNSPAIGPDRIVFGDQAGATMMAADKFTGKLLWKTTIESAPGAIITTSPVIFGNRVYVGVSSLQEVYAAIVPGFQLTFRGSIVSLDLFTGQVVWKTYTVPEGYTGGPVWGSNFVIDLKRNALYAATGNNYSVPAPVTACLAGATTPATKLACLDPNDSIDAVLSLDLTTGKIKWANRRYQSDTFTVSCDPIPSPASPCPAENGPDYDFGSAPNAYTAQIGGRPVDVIGTGEKSGTYWALSADDGHVLWGTNVGPGSADGGILWGSATDGKRIYTENDDGDHVPFQLSPSKTQTWNAGTWAALDAATGAFLWQVPASGLNPTNPQLPSGATGQVTVANGVFYAGALSGDMVALDAATGKTLWKFASGGSVVSGPSIVDGTLYWGSGYAHIPGKGTPNNKLYAFTLPR